MPMEVGPFRPPMRMVVFSALALSSVLASEAVPAGVPELLSSVPLSVQEANNGVTSRKSAVSREIIFFMFLPLFLSVFMF